MSAGLAGKLVTDVTKKNYEKLQPGWLVFWSEFKPDNSQIHQIDWGNGNALKLYFRDTWFNY
jgi:hypothetical protein